jgi:hypothetical protein
MTDPSLALVLGFIGAEEVHKDNSRALLNDLIDVHKRTVKKAPVKVILAVDDWTDTMNELADYALTSGFTLDLIGHEEAFDDTPALGVLLAHPDCDVIQLEQGVSIGRGVVTALSAPANARLIIVGDPEEDDDVYTAVALACKGGITVRSLLHGLDDVAIIEDEPEEVAEVPRVVEELESEDLVEEENFDAIGEDGGYDEEPPEAPLLAGDEDDDPGVGEDDDETIGAEPDAPEDEEDVAVATEEYTDESLRALAEGDPEAFNELGAKYGRARGRGIKTDMMIAAILAGGVENVPTKSKTPPGTKKKATPKKVAAVKQLPVEPRTKPTPAVPSTNGHAKATSKAVLKAALEAAQSFIDLAKSEL